MTKRIKLTQGKYALVDDEDFNTLRKYKWFAMKCINGKYYAARIENTLSGRKTIYMARVIMGVVRSRAKIDHKNTNETLDNRKTNLRQCSHAENARNSGKQKNNTSGFKGVSWDNRNKKYRAGITVNRKTISLGSYDTALFAARVYDLFAKQYHGEFAKLNFGGGK